MPALRRARRVPPSGGRADPPGRRGRRRERRRRRHRASRRRGDGRRGGAGVAPRRGGGARPRTGRTGSPAPYEDERFGVGGFDFRRSGCERRRSLLRRSPLRCRGARTNAHERRQDGVTRGVPRRKRRERARGTGAVPRDARRARRFRRHRSALRVRSRGPRRRRLRFASAASWVCHDRAHAR